MQAFNATFFKGNRERLIQSLPKALIILTAQSAVQESADLAYPFRQDSNFWYLTGISEPDMVLVIDTETAKSTILVPEQNDYQKEWDGEIDKKRLQATSGVELVESIKSLESLVTSAIKSGRQIYYSKAAPERIEPYGFYSNPAKKKLEEKLLKLTDKLQDVRLYIARLRQQKQTVEIDAIRRAIQATGASLKKVKSSLEQYSTEKDLERAITAEFYRNGADGHAYEPIIASGINASIIHYDTNSDVIKTNSLILLDVGAKVDGYAADISRTWAVGSVTEKHKAVFDSVDRLQQEAFALLRAGVNIREYQETMEASAAKETKKLGMKKRKYPHGFSHFLGLDVHDAGDYDAPLTAGTIITVEPGLYFNEIEVGVRLEDNVLITENGIENLSELIPRTL